MNKYGTSRMSTKVFYVHHMQRMSTAAVSYDAKAIRRQVTCVKQRAMGITPGATHVAGAGVGGA